MDGINKQIVFTFLMLIIIAVFLSSCATDKPSQTVRRYYECYNAKDADCLLHLFGPEYFKGNTMGDTPLTMKKTLEIEFEKMRYDFIRMESESSSENISDVVVIDKRVPLESCPVCYIQTEKKIFSLKKIDGKWLIENIDYDILKKE